MTSFVPYHRLARTDAHRWWRPVLGTAFIVVAGAVLALLAYLIFGAAAALAGRPDVAGEVPAFGALGDLAISFLIVATLLPVTLLAVR